MSAPKEYAELLKLIEISGPFLSLPIFREVFPQGLQRDDPALVASLRERYDEWRDTSASARHHVSPALRAWASTVFHDVLGWPAEALAEANAIPPTLVHTVPQHQETLRPDIVLMQGDQPLLLIQFLAPSQEPDKRPPNTTWNATCSTRMAELLRATRVPLGLLINGERWSLVYAEPDKPTGTAEWRAELWLEERLTLRAFRDLLGAESFFGRPDAQTPAALYRRSLENQQEVSTTLGRQVRRAVEMFVAALDRANREQQGRILDAIEPEQIYEASLSVMMRLVFLLFAEERDLLPIADPIYQAHYAVSTLHGQLRESGDAHSEEVLERRYDAWSRLLATFRAVHAGADHDLFALPAYGGHLFDPDRYPFLEGRPAGSHWLDTPALPVPVNNRTVLHMLEALQFLEMKVAGGGTEKRRVSFRSLDIEQVGHVYEGLLDHTVRRAGELIVGLNGPEEPELPLAELERRAAQPGFTDWLKEQTGRSAAALEKARKQEIVADPARWPDGERVKPFAALIRVDDNQNPVVIPEGSVYVTAGAERRQTGTQYTPRQLTESVVEHALTPTVYHGPAEGLPPEEWKLKPAHELLHLKICDPACGSAAFLVAAARFLSARLVEAWEAAQREHGEGVQITPYGHASLGASGEEILPKEAEERSLFALRLVVERCLYGVDRNPLAVEMAKLSLWLLTLQRRRPFTFVDHAIRCGDSLLGVTQKQLEAFDLSGEGKQYLIPFQDDLSFAADKRDGISKAQYHPEDQQRLLEAAVAKTHRIRVAADLLLATAFENNPENLAQQVAMGLEQQEEAAAGLLAGRRTFHWPVEFPEVFLHRGGFDAIVGNPPFIGGQRITGALGREYRDYLVKFLAGGRRGSADYVAYFFLRGFSMLREGGTAGLLATNTIAQGDTREVGLDQLVAYGASIYRAITSRKWPGDASLEVAHIWMRKGEWQGGHVLDDRAAKGITSQLAEPGEVQGKPFRLAANQGKSFQGSNVLGLGFVLEPSAAQALLDKDSRNRDVLFPYLNGEDLNSRWDQSPSRWVINFHDWPLERAQSYPDCFEIVERLVKPEREKLAGGDASARDRARRWWQFARPTMILYATIAGLERVLVVSLVNNHLAFALVHPRQVFAHRLAVVAAGSGAFAVLQSSFHYVWAWHYSSTLRRDINYSPSDCLETFPFPMDESALEAVGQQYQAAREELLATRREGLTSIYNRFHSGDEASDVVKLRALHVEMDYAVAAAYDWTNPDLGHGFHETRQGLRYTISEEARRKVLDNLLALNHDRHAQEQDIGETAPKRKAARKRTESQGQLF